MITYTATCLFGLEGLLAKEIDELGYRRLYSMDGRVTFEGDNAACARSNINLRFAERLYINLGTFDALSFDQLFEGVRMIEWEEYISAEDAFPVNGHSIRSKLFSVPDCQKIIKKSIAGRLGAKYGLKTLPENSGITYKIEFFLFKDQCTLMIDTSGVALHKRGYRPETVTAPLRETLAAALASFSRPRENVLFCDPFCGSGTIAIEAAMIMKNIAPGLTRCFSAQSFSAFPAKLWIEAKEEAQSKITSTDFRVKASDIDPKCVRIAAEACKRAGVDEIITVEKANALDLKPSEIRGTIVTNPPYGERLLTKTEANELYSQIGKVFRALDPWQVYILTPNENFEKLYGRKADKVRKLYNGMIPCYYFNYFKPHKKQTTSTR